MGAAATAAAAAVVRKERQIVEAYRAAGATCPDRAQTPEDLMIHRHVIFQRLVRRAVLRDAGDGRYFLDEPTWRAVRGMRRRLAFTIAAMLLALLVGLIAFSGIARFGAGRS